MSATSSPRIWDISQTLRAGLPVWPGDTPFSRRARWTLGEGSPVNVGSFETTVHAGAHADAPLHYQAGGASAAEVALEAYIGPCTLVDARRCEAAITRDQADRALRHRFGQSETARQRQAQAATMRREAELAAGHGEVRLSGFITVSGRDAEELRRSCAEIHDHAARARLELHRLYGQQADAFTFTLPLCRGLR